MALVAIGLMQTWSDQLAAFDWLDLDSCDWLRLKTLGDMPILYS